MSDERGLLGVIVFLFFLGLAALYLLVASQLMGGLDSSPIVQDESFSDPDAMINGTGMWERSKDIGLIAVPLILVSTGMVWGTAYYIRRERTGGRRPPI